MTFDFSQFLIGMVIGFVIVAIPFHLVRLLVKRRKQ